MGGVLNSEPFVSKHKHSRLKKNTKKKKRNTTGDEDRAKSFHCGESDLGGYWP